MRRPSRNELGVLLVLLGVVSIVLSLGGSALAAPDIEQGTAGERGRTIVGVQGAPDPGQVLMLDSSGETLWSVADASSYHDVTMLDNGSVLTTPIVKDQRECGQFPSPCARTGVRMIDPEPSPHVTSEWTFPVRTGQESEVHDAEVLPSGELLIADMDRERVFTVAQNGTITWQWNASEHYDPPADPTKTDWLHINDVDRIGPDKFLVSVRNANQLVIVERGQGVVDVINEDGDPDVLSKQHNPQYLGPGAVLVADSENDRVVELHEIDGEWRVVWSVDSANGITFDWPRDADRLSNGNTLITDSRRNRLVEVNESGETVWSVEVPNLPYEADRIPEGERPSGPLYGQSGEPDRSGAASLQPQRESDLPIFGTAHAALTHVVPVPFWLRPWHLLVVTVGLVSIVAGSLLSWTASSTRAEDE